MSRSKYNKDFKVKVLEDEVVKNLIATKKDNYKNGVAIPFEINGETIYIQTWETYCSMMRGESAEFDCACLMIRGKQAKARKVKEKITNIVMNHNAVFLTLTFTDEVLSKTSEKTRRKYVSRYLKECSDEYVGNIDFSPEIGREHYHAIVCGRVDLKKWLYGFAYAEKIRAHDRDLCKLSKYITKLTAHALKVDATRLIYSRVSSNM